VPAGQPSAVRDRVSQAGSMANGSPFRRCRSRTIAAAWSGLTAKSVVPAEARRRQQRGRRIDQVLTTVQHEQRMLAGRLVGQHVERCSVEWW
jgi:hypothetical protein